MFRVIIERIVLWALTLLFRATADPTSIGWPGPGPWNLLTYFPPNPPSHDHHQEDLQDALRPLATQEIRRLRKQKKTLAKISKRVGVSRQTVANYS